MSRPANSPFDDDDGDDKDEADGDNSNDSAERGEIRTGFKIENRKRFRGQDGKIIKDQSERKI